MATQQNTQKYSNIIENENVSVLVHDWTTLVPSSLAKFLEQLNKNELTQRSATIYGKARAAKGEEAEFYRQKYLELNPEANCFISNAEIILITLDRAVIADSHNHVERF